MNDLLQWLTNFALDHDIGVIFTPYFEPTTPSQSNGDYRVVVINSNWHNQNEVPFCFAHEIGHVLNHDSGVNNYSSPSVSSKEEYQANLKAIQLLLLYCKINDIHFQSSIEFCRQFGVPMNYEYMVELVLNNMN